MRASGSHASWCARETPLAPAGLGVSWAFLAYDVVACVTLAWGRPALAGGGLPALGTSALHGVLAAALLGALLGRGWFRTGPFRSGAGVVAVLTHAPGNLAPRGGPTRSPV
jgi:hypothetical protein